MFPGYNVRHEVHGFSKDFKNWFAAQDNDNDESDKIKPICLFHYLDNAV